MATLATSIPRVVIGHTPHFRRLGQTISQFFASVGWVQTADTGQVDWNTVEAPSVGGSNTIYEIWRMNDAAQATAPIYLRITYDAMANGATILFNVGTGTDGAGVIQNSFSVGNQSFNVTSVTGGNGFGNLFLSGDAGRFSMIWCDFAVCAIERTRDATGAVTTDGASFHLANSGGSFTNRSVGFPGPVVFGLETNWITMQTTRAAGTLWSGNQTAWASVFPWRGNQPGGPLVGVKVWHALDAHASAQCYAVDDGYGTTRQYLPMQTSFSTALGGNTNSRVAILWE